jgi:phenylalanyl-tRNA synthetase beta chain
VVIAEHIPFSKVYDIVAKTAGTLLVDLNMFDVYQGGEVKMGHRSLAISLTLQHPHRTLVDEEINTIIAAVIEQLTVKLNGTLRA